MPVHLLQVHLVNPSADATRIANMAAPKPLQILGWFLGKLVFWLVAFPLLLAADLVFVIVTLPYTLFYFSSNWSMLAKYNPPVELYLSHFERHHPYLMTYVAYGNEAANRSNSEPPGISFWPHKTRRMFLYLFCVGVSSTSWQVMHSAAFFARLEAAGWDRRVLWSFLRDSVERHGQVTPEQSAAFDAVMQRMTTHHIVTKVADVYAKVSGRITGAGTEKARQLQLEKRTRRERLIMRRFGHLGRPIVRVTEDSVDWIEYGGAILVPDAKTRPKLRTLASFSPVWEQIRERDLERGIPDVWQLADVETVFPWQENETAPTD
ncbi:hypothetical protein VTK73DRAFT_9869 [Phialemonium thermophilum]|uniref:Uncharacterized protein n=1 Tax=Phialemonium thermophilum TaxID=223376 RepID=A0ABR3W003_9PEZI